MRKIVKIKYLSLGFSVFAVVACSHKKANVQETPEQVSAPVSKEDSTLNSVSEDAGVLNFFDTPGIERGLVVRAIKWGEPISSDNPGADCELRRRLAGPPTNVFACVVREAGKEAVVLTLHEEIQENKRHLKRITMDGKGADTRDRWQKTLMSLGYTQSKMPNPKPSRVNLISKDAKTMIQIIWAANANAVTLIVDPAH